MSFVAKLVKTGSVPIFLVTFLDTSDREVHFYVKSTQAKIDALLKRTGGTFDLNDYGEILVGGFGKTPTEETKRVMKEKYGFEG